jgi:Flp pilus assembly protein TadD
MYRSQDEKLQKKSNAFVSRILAAFVVTILLLALTLAPVIPAQGRSVAGSIELSIYSNNGEMLDTPARISISSNDGVPGMTQTVCNDGVAWFSGLPQGSYILTVDAPGFQLASTEADLLEVGTVQASVTLQPAPQPSQGPGSLSMVLAPKAKADLDAGLTAMRANKLDEAQEDLGAAYNLAPGDADVNDALGLLFMLKKDLSQAQQYIETATSLDPDNINALVDSGQLRLMQNNSTAAVAPLRKATALEPHDKFAHWLLGITYLQLGLFEKARHEALEAIKANKGKPTDAQFLLGQAEASLGRTTEAIKTLQKFVRQLPNDHYAPAARSLIADLQTQPLTPGAPVVQQNAPASATAKLGGATTEAR